MVVPYGVKRWILSVGTAAALTLPAGCATVNRLNLLSTEQEVEIGRQAAGDVKKELRMLADPVVVAYVDSLGQVLADHSARTDIRYHIDVVDTEEVNAFALPGGWLYVNAGLIATAESEHELAGVMGHEIGHIVGRHGARQISAQYGLSVLLELVAGSPSQSSLSRQIAAQFAGIGAGMTLLKYSRDMEREADRYAVEETWSSGIDPLGVGLFFEKLMKLHEREPKGMEVLFTTHPPTGERIGSVKAHVAELPARPDLRTDSARFQRVRERLRAHLARKTQGK